MSLFVGLAMRFPTIDGGQRRNADTMIMAFCVVGLWVTLSVMPLLLSPLPSPIGSAAVQFGEGARMTVLLTTASGSAGIVLGVLIALARMSKSRTLTTGALGFVWIIRGTPLLVQILFVYSLCLHFCRASSFRIFGRQWWH
ncbi:MAG: ABC transporter permease subunit [Phyllobacterium sp.]|uniref:ABC transporter permease subunit n=1 Tax=Phyllobacterium sp. TaxID=1871046 RepID=UPI0030F15065